MLNNIREKENETLKKMLKLIKENISCLQLSQKENLKQLKSVGEDTNRSYVLMNFKKFIEKRIDNNIKALDSPYFARIDYYDKDDNKNMSLHIGKHGIEDKESNTLTVDWRAPVSSLYYECQLGENVIDTVEDEKLDVDLNLKRTYEISEGELIDFYDANTITNDELLTKYLAKNKEAVLTDIVATIQKDQNRIIRDSFKNNVIVQGGAGSGKTTVAMHRVSYLLYNHKDIFNPENFYILGSNKMFLNYITSILPSLDVEEIKNMVLSQFFESFISVYLKRFSKKYCVLDKFEETNVEVLSLKGKIGFVKALDTFIKKYEKLNICTDDVYVKNKVVMSKQNIIDLIKTFENSSIMEKIQILNEQLLKKIKILEENYSNINYKKEKQNYKNYFGNPKAKINIVDIYLEFLADLKELFNANEKLKSNSFLIDIIEKNINKGVFDLFDIAMLNLICKRVCLKNKYSDVKYIVVDEAQDFGVSIFYILKNVFNKSYFSIMGDVAQNINYDIGMNDWETLKSKVFNDRNDVFYTLSKSYRNTLQIANIAFNVLDKAKFKTYPIDPFARIGKDVEFKKINNYNDMLKYTLDKTKNILEKGFETVGIITKTEEEANNLKNNLQKHISIVDMNSLDSTFTDGVMILPIRLSKGLEFDAVILWDANDNIYNVDDKDVKLLYVAVTRALHELYITYSGNISKLLV